jgi:uncharacterized protein YndB with AHSA1/START domain
VIRIGGHLAVSDGNDLIDSGGNDTHVRRRASPDTYYVLPPEKEQQKGCASQRLGLYQLATRRLRMNDRIEKTIELKAPVSRVWRALTDYREFGEWFRVKLDGPFVVGQVARGWITYPGYEHLTWQATVQRMEHERLFAFTWHPYAVDPKVDYSQETPTLVEFRLRPTANGTLLVITESGFDNIPSFRRLEAFRMNDNGWTAQLKNIERHVDS